MFKYSNTVLAEELARSYRLDEKASKYLTALTLVLSAIAFFFKKSVSLSGFQIHDIISCFSFVFIMLILLAWYFIFSCLRMETFKKPPLDQSVLNFFDAHRLIDIYSAMSKGNMEAFHFNKVIGDRKSKALYHSYLAMNTSVILGVTIFVLYLFVNNMI